MSTNSQQQTLSLFFLPTIGCEGQFKVTRAYDGDTIKAEGYDIEIEVRLVGIDTPVNGVYS